MEQTLTNMVAELMAQELENKIVSKLQGRKNYIIRTEINCLGKPVAYVGTQKDMRRWGMLSAMLKDMATYHIRWYEFTYKKDVLTMLDVLREQDYRIEWC